MTDSKEPAVTDSILCVRLKTHQPRAGHVLRQLVYRGILFRAGAGWNKVSEGVGEHLRSVRQRAHDPHSPLAFDVCTEEEARRLDAQDAERNMAVTPVDKARVAVARDEAGAPTGATSSTAGSPELTKDRPSARAKH
jgi:hypothetical protein